MQVLKDLDSYMPDEAALAQIHAQIDGYNRERPAIYQSCMRWALVSVVIYAAFALLIVIHVSQLDIETKTFWLVVGVLGIGGAFLWNHMWSPMRSRQAHLRAKLFPKLFGFVEDAHYDHGQKPEFLKHIGQLKVIRFDESSTDDMISGRHDGMAFDLVETTLTTGQKNKETVFRGLIFRFSLATPFPGVLVAAKRGGWLERTMKELLRTGASTELSSGNLRLDESHQFYSDNRKAAQPIIAGPLTSALIWFGNEWHGGDVRIALAGDHGYLLLPSTHDYFRLPGMAEDVMYKRHVRPLVQELATALAVAHFVRQVT